MLKGKLRYFLVALVVAGAAYFLYHEFQPDSERSERSEVKPIDPEFAGYISAFTSGFIGSHSTIRVQLAKEMAGSTRLNTPIEEKLFEFEPKIKGVAVWKDAQTLEFTPDAPLKNGEVYKVTFMLSKLVDVKRELKTFEFQFQVIPQSVQMTSGDLKCYHSGDFKYYSLNGTVNTADKAEKVEVEKTLTATYSGKNLRIKWGHEEDGTVHRFMIDSIQRPAAGDKNLVLVCNGSAIGVDSENKHEFVVTEKEKFVLVNVQVITGNDPYVLLNFSNPVDQGKSLEGLVQIRNLNDVKYVVAQNQVMIYPSQTKTGTYILRVDEGILDARGQRLGLSSEHSIVFTEAQPAVRFIGEGNILPSTNSLTLPFECVNLKAVDVTIVKIYENNVLQFLQNNSIDGSYMLAQVGKKILSKRVKLGVNNPAEYSTWKKFSLDLSSLFTAERGAIYRVSLGFKKSYSTYSCLGNTFGEQFEMEQVEEEEEEVNYFNRYNEYEYEYDYDYNDEESYRWNERNDPCKSSYYHRSENTVTRNILASDIGLTLKRGNDGSFFVCAANLVTSEPMNNVVLELYDYQKQLLQTGSTDAKGMANMSAMPAASFLVAKKDKQFSYLRIDDGAALSLSMYDVSGTAVKKGVKGFIYGERGVWRPGDSLFLNFILEDKFGALPEGHPVVFSLYNPQNQLYKKITTTSSVNGFYNFWMQTDMDVPTGNWTAEVKLGPIKFTKNVRIETIMPNRLKIRLDFGTGDLIAAGKNEKIGLHVNWLTGATAREMPVKMNVALSKASTSFTRYPTYNFDDATAGFESQNVQVFDGKLDENGDATIPLDLNFEGRAPGFLKAAFNTQVFEPGGAFSIDRYTLTYSPFKTYVGIKLPEVQKNSNIIFTNRDHKIQVITVDEKGKLVSRSKIKFELYKLNWRWWWDQYEGELANYASDTYHSPEKTQMLSTSEGFGSVTVNIPDNKWGRYLVRITDQESGHSASSVAYFDWANWRERGGNQESRTMANMLSFTTDKTNYASGEEATVNIPVTQKGRALVTIESGSKVLEAYWHETGPSKTPFRFKITPQMAPNVYVHVSLIQPHQRENDLPIRMYGVVPVSVDDAHTHLRPAVKMPDVLEPEKPVSISVSEENGKEMAFTLAIVDEGLLDLTRFKTPDPHKTFYAREALGVKTWDVYDDVIGAFGAQLERILSIGGDGSEINNDAAKANRFKPMVRVFGPYHLGKGDKKQINFTMPMYVGSVRVMLIAGNNGAYGTHEKTCPVKAPLMLLGTLPRVLSTGEEVKLPVSVFGGDKNIGATNVKVEVNGLLQVQGKNVQSVHIAKNDEKLVLFDIKVKPQTGIAKVRITAAAGSHKASYDMELDVRNPNPYETKSKGVWLEAGKTITENYAPFGVEGTNSGMLEVSAIPPLNIEERVKYLVHYPHGCIEQTSSAAFAQLCLPQLIDLSPEMKNEVERNVKAGLNALRNFQLANGGLSYWPGQTDPSDWGTSYAGHFFLSAEKKGYALPANLKKNWIAYQQSVAQSFEFNRSRNASLDELQAYRLYVLALAGNPVMGAMNRLRENAYLSNNARWLLASAYAQIGQMDEAAKLIQPASAKPSPYVYNPYTYGSSQRDQAVILQCYSLMNRKNDAFRQLMDVSEFLSSGAWYSTQTIAYSFLAVNDFMARFGASSALQVKCSVNGSDAKIRNGAAVAQTPLPFKGTSGGSYSVQNNGKGPVYVRYTNRGKAPVGEEKPVSSSIGVSVKYKSVKGDAMNPAEISQGTNFLMSVTVQNSGEAGVLRDIALSSYIPSGWEIHNARMDDNEAAMKNSAFTYQDIRDDRVFTYFDLRAGESKTFNLLLNASYEGRFYLPGAYVEAMYDNSVVARSEGQWIQVLKK